jgi:L-fuculose-phosphate aldolase
MNFNDLPTKSERIAHAQQQMAVHLDVPPWTLRQKVALTCAILFSEGHGSGLAGQITARIPDTENFYTQRLGLGLEEINASNLLVVDDTLTVLEGQGMANPANLFHTWIYKRRPDVRCVVHTHPMHISALSMLEQPLIVSHMDTCVLYDDVAFLKTWPGVPVGDSEGELISQTLGDKRAALLAHHGLVVACGSVEEACIVAIQCERAARLQLLAMAAGKIQPVSPDAGREAHDWILQERRSQANFSYYARSILRRSEVCLH